MGCVQSASFVVLINGSSSNFFRASRGLRQGCPLSPFLFLLIADALSKIINYANRGGSFKGIQITSSVDLTHILFVDDVIMMGEGTWENLKEAEKILELYKKATGMHINVEKSILSENAITEAIEERIRVETPYILKPMDEGFKYPGFVLKPNAYCFKDWMWLYKKIESRIGCWTFKFLSIGGRLVLLKAVLQSIPV